MTVPIAFSNSYAAMPARFFARVAPTPVASPELIVINTALAETLRIDTAWLRSPAGLDMLSGRALPEGAEPIASAYAGHQFGNFVPQLGDGRAVLLGEVVDRDGQRRDIQLKGAGPTPFSRAGDGRAALGPVMREYIVSEAMHAFGIPTTRALAAVLTGESVYRETPLPGAVLTRVAASHIRIGTFQFFAARGDHDGVKALADHVVARHYPEASDDPTYRKLLDGVIARQAKLVAQWLCVGFIHGVMNTDNMSIAGETIDYGPCAFLDAYDAQKVFSSIDQFGRYAYGNQPSIALWNLTRLAECLLPFLADTEAAAISIAEDALSAFSDQFTGHYRNGMREKLGLLGAHDDDALLIDDLLKAMARAQADFTLTFRALADALDDDIAPLRTLFAESAEMDEWIGRWRTRLADDPNASKRLRAANPIFIPRNHRIEEAIVAGLADDFEPFYRLVDTLSRPYDDDPERRDLTIPPLANERVERTFCGT